MNSAKQQKLNEILDTIQNQEQYADLFPQKNPFLNYTLNLPFIRHQFDQTYYIQENPFPLPAHEKYKFVNCKPFYQRRLAFYDQINYVESKLKDAYLPRDSLTETIEKDWNTSGILKKRGNTLITKCLPDNTLVSIFPYFPYNLGMLLYKYSPKGEDPDDYYSLNSSNILNLQSYDISSRISPTQILQIEKGYSNEFIVRTLYKCFRLKLDLHDFSLDYDQSLSDHLQFLHEMSFPSEVLEAKASPFLEHQSFYLCNQNKLFLQDNNINKPISLPINFPEGTGILERSHCFEQMDVSYSPTTLLLGNYRQIHKFDTRENSTSVLISSRNSDTLRMIYGLKHLKDQYFSVTDSNALCIYDIRYLERPVFEFQHLSDENPPDIIEYSQVYDPLETNGLNDIEDLLGLMESSQGQDQEVTGNNNNRVLYGFSTNKNGSALMFPNKVFGKFEKFKDKYFDVEKEDDYMLTLQQARKPRQGTLSHLFFENYQHTRLLFNTAIVNEGLGIKGMGVVHFDKDILVTVCDSKNNLSFQVMRNQGDRYVLHRVSKQEQKMEIEEDEDMLELDDNRGFSEWSQLNKRIRNKIYGKAGNKRIQAYKGDLFKEKLYFGIDEKAMKEEEEEYEKVEMGIKEEQSGTSGNNDTEEEESSDESSANEDKKEENFVCYNFRPIVELLCLEEDSFNTKYKKLAKVTIKEEQLKKEGIWIKEPPLDDYSLPSNNVEAIKRDNMFPSSEIRVKKDEGSNFLRSLFEEKKSTEFLKATKPFLVNKALINHLEDAW